MLKVTNISVSYKKTPVVREVSLEVSEGQIVSILGSNGAGKSTILKCISGLIHPVEGNIVFLGEKIHSKLAYQVAQRGLCLIPEGSRVFSKLSIEDNLRMGTFAKKPGYMMNDLSRKVYDMFPVLYERRNLKAETLSGGERQMLAIGRALMSQPKLLMLDEPTAGLAPKLAQEVFRFIVHIKGMGLTILLVEQQVEQTLEISDFGYVLENGRVVAKGEATILLHSDKVREAYLGL